MLEKITASLDRRDEKQYVELAEELSKTKEASGIEQLVRGLDHADERIVNGCIKVLYEIGYRKPEFLIPFTRIFISKLNSRNNRLIWGASIALACIADKASTELFEKFETIYKAYQKGSVITRDNCVSIFAGIIKGNKAYNTKIFPLLIDHLTHCRPKEVPQHAERAFVCINGDNMEEFKKILTQRYEDLSPTQQKRIDTLFKKIDSVS